MRTFVLSLILVGASAAATANSQSITFGLRAKVDNPEHAARVASKFGRLVSRDRMTGTYSLSLTKDRDAKVVLKAIQSRGDIVFARLSDPTVNTNAMPMDSVSGMTHSIEELKARKVDHILMAKSKGLPAPAKTETVKTGYYESHLYWLRERAYPGKKVDYNAYRLAAEQVAQMPSEGAASDGTPASWQYLGPINLDVPYRTYYGVRPINGRANAFAVDPSNTNTFYLGSANGGVLKSTDRGTTWTHLTDYWPFLTVSSLAIDPANPQTVYAGTGDFPGGKNFTMGVMKSTNGGASWTQYTHPDFANAEISSIVIDPENPQIVTMTCGRGTAGGGYIMRSTNGGVTWSRAINSFGQWFRVELGPLEPGNVRMYYAVGSGIDNIWKSSDRGVTWTRMATPYTSSVTTIQVAASPVNPGTVYLMSYLAIYKSTNYGATWTNVTAGFPNGSSNYFWSQFSYNWFFDVSSAPGNVDVIYVGAIDCAQSPDGGATWRSIGGPTFSGVALTHNDQHYIAVDPTNPNRVHMGGDGGAFEYVYNPSTSTGTWNYFSRDLGITQFYKIAVHPTNPDYVMGGTQDNATPHSLGNLGLWDNVGGGDGGFCCINPNNTNVQYATSQSLNIYRTGNGWASSSGINPSTGTEPRAFIAPIVLDPNNPNLLYAGTNFLYRRNDSTGTWTNRLGGQQLSASGVINEITIARGDSNRIYTGSNAGEIWTSGDGGSTWRNISTGFPNRSVTSIQTNPIKPTEIYVTVSSTGTAHLWRCPDTTAATIVWQDVDGSGLTGVPNTPTSVVVLDPFDFENVWYVGTDLGVFKTEDAGATWTNATQPLGLPNTSIGDMEIAPATGYLTAGTFGRGMWRLKLPDVFSPTTVTTIVGTPFGGNAASLFNSDNSYLTTLFDLDSSNGEIDIIGTSPIVDPSRLDVAWESSTTHPDLSQVISMFNHTTGNWETFSAQFINNTDQRKVIRVTSNAARFVHPTSRQVRTKIRWIPTEDLSTIDGWQTQLDRLQWRAHP